MKDSRVWAGSSQRGRCRLVSRSGAALPLELTVAAGLAAGWSEVPLDTHKAFPAVHLPGRVLADLAVMIADGGDALSHLAVLRDQDKLFARASDATARRCVDRVDAAHLARLQEARNQARELARAADAGPDLSAGLIIDFAATITIAHSETENAATQRTPFPQPAAPPAAGAGRSKKLAAAHRR